MSTTVPSKENYTLITESTTLPTTHDMTGLSPAPDREQEIRDRRAAVPDAPWGVYRSLEGQYTVQAGAYVTLPEGFASTGDVATVLGDDEESRYRRSTFIARAPRDIDDLLALVDQLRDRNAALEAIVAGTASPVPCRRDDNGPCR